MEAASSSVFAQYAPLASTSEALPPRKKITTGLPMVLTAANIFAIVSG